MPVPLSRDCDSGVDEGSHPNQAIPLVCRGGVDGGFQSLENAIDGERLAECETD